MDSPYVSLVFAVYLIALAVLGYVGYKKTKNLSDYYIGGKTLGTLSVALSGVGTAYSAWVIFSAPWVGFTYGWNAAWMFIPMISWHAVMWLFIAPRLYKVSSFYKSVTFLELLSDRVKDNKRLIQGIGSILVFFFMVAYTASQFMGSGSALVQVFGVKYITGLLIGVAIVLGYTLFGGFYSVCYTDVMQAMVMFSFLAIVPWVLLSMVGGISGINAAISTVDAGKLVTLTANMPAGTFIRKNLLGVFWLTSWFAFAQPQLAVRIMAAKSKEALRPTGLIAVVFLCILTTGALTIGICTRAWAIQNGVSFSNGEVAMYFIIGKLFHPVMLGILTAATLSAIMSSTDSFLLLASSCLVRDFIERFLGKKIDEKKQLFYCRIGTFLCMGLALWWALKPETIHFLVVLAWCGVSAMFGGAILACLYWKRVTKEGIFYSMLTGFVVTVLWYWSPLNSYLHFQWVSTPVAILVLIVVSYFTKAPLGIDEEFEAFKITESQTTGSIAAASSGN